MIHIEHFTFNSFQTNSFILWDESGKCAIADPGCSSEAEFSRLTGFIADKGLEPVCILLTHCHFDHVYGMAALAREYEIPVYADMNEMYSLQVTNAKLCGQFGFPMPDEFPIIRTSSDVHHPAKAIFVQDGDTIDVGNLRFEVIQPPFWRSRRRVSCGVLPENCEILSHAQT